MSYFLWIEDFENSPKVTAHDVFGNTLNADLFSDNKYQLKKNLQEQGVFIELNFQDGLSFIRQNLHKIDYVILDIDLPAYSEGDEINADVLKLFNDFQDYEKLENEEENEALIAKNCKQLKEIAGFYLYTELVVELGFPKQHILFCSNHAENAKTTRDAFKAAKIALPRIYEKSNSEVEKWVKEKSDSPYSQLRRGIIEGCNHLKTLTENKFRFNSFIQEDKKQVSFFDIANYVAVLEKFLSLNEPKNKEKDYKLFVSILAHEWEAAEPRLINGSDKKTGQYAFAWIMKITRNWIAHSKLFEKLTSEDVAFLFIINMRAMFDLGNELLPYEQHLLSLFVNPLSNTEIKEKIGTNFKSRKLPLIENYAALLKKTRNTRQTISFHDALNNLQKNKQDRVDNKFFIQGLYQNFWFLTSYGSVYIPDDKTIKKISELNYQFKYFTYQENYLFEIARHIYHRSFTQS